VICGRLLEDREKHGPVLHYVMSCHVMLCYFQHGKLHVGRLLAHRQQHGPMLGFVVLRNVVLCGRLFEHRQEHGPGEDKRVQKRSKQLVMIHNR
jgi:hypothetical protein